MRDNNYQKVHIHEFPIIKEGRWRNGAKTKYDIPQYIRNIPEEYPAICTIKEAGILRNIKKKEEKEKEKEKKKKMQLDLDIKNNKEKEEQKENNAITNNNSIQKVNKNNDLSKNKKTNNINNILEEPIPNEMHKYCHLCKKQFDNYLRHINSKNHKEIALKYNDTFISIKNIFHNINSFWSNKKDNNENIQKKNIISNISKNLNEIEEKIEFDNEYINENNNIKQKILSQFNQGTREGCKAKRKILSNNSQLSTAQSSPMIPPVKRNKQTYLNKGKSKSKKTKIPNKSIKEFLVRGEFIITKNKKDEEKIFS